MSAVTIENDLVHYEVLGRGRPVVLLHGWMSSWRYWIPSMQQLSMKYRVYALDLWGYGDSGKDPKRFTLDSHVLLLGEFMDKLGIPKAAFVGHSLGAAVMVRYAVSNPDRVARMMIVSPPLFASQVPEELPDDPVPSTSPPPAAPTVMTRPPGLQDRLRGAAPAHDEATRPMAPPHSKPTVYRRPDGLDDRLRSDGVPAPDFGIKPGDPIPKLSDLDSTPNAGDAAASAQDADTPLNPLRDLLLGKTASELLASHLDKDTPEYDRLLSEAAKTADTAFAASALSFDRVNLPHDIRRLATPTLLLHGEEDGFLPAPTADMVTFLGHKTQGIRCEVVPHAGHFPMLSDPTNFHRLMMDFLEARALSQLVLHKERWVRKVR